MFKTRGLDAQYLLYRKYNYVFVKLSIVSQIRSTLSRSEHCIANTIKLLVIMLLLIVLR